jgi:PAS domain S-box-containing protein
MHALQAACELLDDVSCGFVSFADDGRVLFVNRTLCGLVGKPREEVVGRHVESLLTVGSRIFYQTHFFPLLKLHGHAHEIYLALQSPAGSEVPALVNAVRHERAGQVASECIVLPMRQRNEYEDRILEARKVAEDAARAKDQFLAVVSHELRTPLTAVLGWARLLKTGKLDTADTKRAVEAIERNAEAQARLIEDLLDLSRIITGRLRLDVAPVELAAVAEAAMDVVRPAADAKGIRMISALDPRAGPVAGGR